MVDAFLPFSATFCRGLMWWLRKCGLMWHLPRPMPKCTWSNPARKKEELEPRGDDCIPSITTSNYSDLEIHSNTFLSFHTCLMSWWFQYGFIVTSSRVGHFVQVFDVHLSRRTLNDILPCCWVLWTFRRDSYLRVIWRVQSHAAMGWRAFICLMILEHSTRELKNQCKAILGSKLSMVLRQL